MFNKILGLLLIACPVLIVIGVAKNIPDITGPAVIGLFIFNFIGGFRLLRIKQE